MICSRCPRLLDPRGGESRGREVADDADGEAVQGLYREVKKRYSNHYGNTERATASSEFRDAMGLAAGQRSDPYPRVPRSPCFVASPAPSSSLLLAI